MVEVTFRLLFEDWAKEEFKGAMEIDQYADTEGNYRLWLTFPEAPMYLRNTKICVGWIGHNDVQLKTYTFKGFGVPIVNTETKNVADPDFFQWIARTIRVYNYSDSMKAGIL